MYAQTLMERAFLSRKKHLHTRTGHRQIEEKLQVGTTMSRAYNLARLFLIFFFFTCV